MIVFVTGGTGLVGSHTIQMLCRRGDTVRALVRNESGKNLVESLGATAVFGCVEDPKAWDGAAGTDAIVHSAAVITTRLRWETFEVINIDGARNAALTAAQKGIRLVHISSVAVYGREARLGPACIDENTEWAKLADSEFYALSKRRAEEAVFSVARDTRLSAVALRPCVIYGERDRTFLPPVVRILRFGFAPLIGPGNNPLPLVYAGNVAEAVLAALDRPTVRGPINVANDGVVTQRGFYTAVGMALGNKTRLVRIPAPVAYIFAASRNGLRRMIDPKKYAGFGASAVGFLSEGNPYRSERARSELGWLPSTPPEEAIARSVRWFDEQL